jgi:hypothetical protein
MLPLLLACTAPDSADSGEPPTDSDSGDTDSGLPGEVVAGAACPVETRIAEIDLYAWGDTASLSATVYDRPNPWYGPASLDNGTCAYHHVDPNACGSCDDGQVCGWEGTCVPEQRARHDVEIDVLVDGVSTPFLPDEATGQLWGDVGPADATYVLSLHAGDTTLVSPELRLAAELADALVLGTGSYDAPTLLEASWTPSSGRVRSVIPINHHAGGPTFTFCDVAADPGGFTATAEMLQPLAVSTGLEFQGLEHVESAAAEADGVCVEFRAGTNQYVSVTWAD